jgi:hypothetical protein
MAQPLSKEFLLERGVCCGNGCRNCPYTPKHTKGNKLTIKNSDNEIREIEGRVH